MSIIDNSSCIAGSFLISVPMRLAWLSLIVLICSSFTLAQTEQSPARLAVENNSPTPEMAIDPPEDQQKVSGTIIGSVVGQDGIAVVGAKVKLTQEGQSVS